MSVVTKVWIDEGCIVCDACETTCPEVFEVTEDTCLIKDGVNPNDFSEDIIEAADGCPVDVIIYEIAGAEDDSGEGEVPAEVEPEAAPEQVAPVAAAGVAGATAAPAGVMAAGEGEDELAAVMNGDRSLHVLFGSQSGNSEVLAATVSKKSADYGLECQIHDMDGFDLASMASMKRILIICSTWGEGDMPDNAEDLWQAANADGAPNLSGTHFSVLALGDTSYEFYCQSGIEWDTRLGELGSTRITDRVDCDVDYDVPAAAWMSEAMAAIACVDDTGTFHADLVEQMKSKAAGDTSAAGAGVAAIVVLPEIQVTVSIFRYDAQTGAAGQDTWACAIPGHHSVLDLLRTLKATQDGSLTFRDGADSDPSTGLMVNGRLVLPGMARISDCVRVDGMLRVEPLAAYEVIRDLVVDLSTYQNMRASSEPWFVGREREGVNTEQAVMGVMDASVATTLHASNDISSQSLLHASSDTVQVNPDYIGPAVVGQLWNRACDPRLSDKAGKRILTTLCGINGIKAEADMASVSRQGRIGTIGAGNLLEAKNAVLGEESFSGRHGKHVWWFTWTVKSSGLLNETILAMQTMGPLGMMKNLPQMVRMSAGFTRTGGPIMRDKQSYLAAFGIPASIGKLPPLVNSSVDNHHEVVALFNAFDKRF